MKQSLKDSSLIRQEFIEFFQNKEHTLVSSASLIPDNDQSLLFTNAGMNQFKDVFLNTGSRPFTKAVDTQKVMRVSGKHNDFDDVGRDTYHHTFFEMLGNWSFGDYYKKEAITWAWELLTKKWNLPKERLYITVYETDDESFDLWLNETDVDKTHVLKYGKKENFWEMGATGPCGPCSEIHIDLTPDLSQSIGEKGVNADDPLFIELWNLVFIQYNRLEDGSLQDLPLKHVDTGMGFERITAVLQNKTSNYDTDLFAPIIEFLVKDSSIPYQIGSEGTPHRVIADHIRALTFAIGDSIIPSNEGRGYVIRKILRRAVRFGRELGYKKPFLYKLVTIVITIMGDAFPEIKDKKSSIESVIRSEEESFFRTLNKGFDKIKELIYLAKSSHNKVVSGDDAFLLYDSMGFPIDFTEQILKDEDLTFDQDRFNILMQEQKKRARLAWKGDGINFDAFGNIAQTDYLDHDLYQSEARIIGLVKESNKVMSCTIGDDIALVLDKTPFYGEKGGQIGDSGLIKIDEENIIEIFDTKIFQGKYIHLGKVLKGSFKENDLILAIVDKNRKKDIARNHSAAHLLFKALRLVLGDHIAQAGSWVGDNRVRIDFTHPKAISSTELAQITTVINKDIIANYQTNIIEMPIDQAKASGAIATFEEKYGDIVRVVTIGDSIELCGGTHISSTGEIGVLTIINESSVSAGTRRLEALVGNTALDYINNSLTLENNIAQTLKCATHDIFEKLNKVLEESKQKDREIKKLNTLLAKGSFTELQNKAHIINSNTIIIAEVDLALIQGIGDYFKNSIKSGVLVLGAQKSDGGAIINAIISKDLTNTIKAGDLIKEIAPIIEGNGGGKSDQAMAGGKNGANLQDALTESLKIIKNSISKI